MAWISRYGLPSVPNIRAFFIFMNEIQVFEYKGNKVTFDFGNGVMTNATEMARAFGKEPYGWIRLATTKEFLWQLLIEKYPKSVPQNLRNETGNLRNETELGAILTEVGLVKIIQGGNSSLQGTWFNDDITIEFARWLSPAFAIWCNDRIKEYLMNGFKPLSKAEMRMQVFMDMQSEINRQSNVIKKQGKRITALLSQLESEKQAKRERLLLVSQTRKDDFASWLESESFSGIISMKEIYRRYSGYCHSIGAQCPHSSVLGKMLVSMERERVRRNGGSYYIFGSKPCHES